MQTCSVNRHEHGLRPQVLLPVAKLVKHVYEHYYTSVGAEF